MGCHPSDGNFFFQAFLNGALGFEDDNESFWPQTNPFWAWFSGNVENPGIGGGPVDDTCGRALKTARKGWDAVQRAENNWPILNQAALNYGTDPSLLAAIAVRESGFQNSIQANGKGVGVFQITVSPQSGVTSQQAMNLDWSANWASNFEANNMASLQSKFPQFDSGQLLQATATAYNMGPGGISGNPNTIDFGSAPGGRQNPSQGNYGSNVVAIMTCFTADATAGSIVF